MIRIRAGMSYGLTEAMGDGHCGLPVAELVSLATEVLEVGDSLAQTAMELELVEGTVIAHTVNETPFIFLGGRYRAQQVIAERLRCLIGGRLPWVHIDPDKALPWIEKRTGLVLAASQVEA